MAWSVGTMNPVQMHFADGRDLQLILAELLTVSVDQDQVPLPGCEDYILVFRARRPRTEAEQARFAPVTNTP